MKHFFNELFEAIVSFKDDLIEKITVHLAFKMLVKVFSFNLKEYIIERPELKSRIDLLICKFFWCIVRRIMLYYFPPAMIFLVWIDPKLEPIDTPNTYLIICGMGFLLGKLFDWAKSDLDKRMI